MSNDSPTSSLVLVVDDEAIVRFLAVDTLEENGFRVVEAEDANAALKVLAERIPAVKLAVIGSAGPSFASRRATWTTTRPTATRRTSGRSASAATSSTTARSTGAGPPSRSCCGTRWATCSRGLIGCPELQPAETLWTLVDEPVVNRFVPDLTKLIDTITERCTNLTTRRPEISSRIDFAWWPKDHAPA